MRPIVSSLGDEGALRLCYEAGPKGYDLVRLLRRLGAHVEVITGGQEQNRRARPGRTRSSTALASGTGCPSSCPATARSIEGAWTGRWLMKRGSRRCASTTPRWPQTFSHYRAIVVGLDAHLAAVESELRVYIERGPFAELAV